MKSLATTAPRARGLLLALVVACSTLAAPSLAGATPGSDGLDRAERAHPMLQYGARREPGKNVRVIAQLTAMPADPKAFAAAHDAKLKDTFPFINSLVLELHFEDIAALAALPNVRYVSPDGTTRRKAFETDDLKTVYAQTVGATSVWNNTSGLAATGKGVSVAILDTGVNTKHADFHRCTGPVEGDDWKHCPSNITTVRVHGKLGKDFDKQTKDGNGHGTAVAGILGGRDPEGKYIGIAPDARIYSIAIADDKGAAQETDLVRGLQWIYDNHRAANIRVVNISMASSIPTSYRTSPVNAAVEQLWRAGVTVVASAGNKGSDRDATWYAPGNHPLVITVGALDDAQTVNPSDDRLATFSSRGVTQDGFSKPDVVAPGRRIVSVLSDDNATLAKLFPDRVTADKQYIRLSGTSMSAPVVTGSIALLLERFPHLTPNQLKGLLVGSARRYVGQVDQAGAVDIAQAMQQAARGSFVAANAQIPSIFVAPSTVSATQSGPSTAASYWDSAYWDAAYWDAAYWDAAYWDAAYWDAAYWDVSSIGD